MNNSKVIVITSGKGGAGKTAVCACIASCLAEQGKKVLTVDMDAGLRNLDIILGIESEIFDISDIFKDRCSFQKAVIKINDNLDFLAASNEVDYKIDKEQMMRFINSVKKDYDFVLLDAPAGIGYGLEISCAAADLAMVISSSSLSSIIDAKKTVAAVDKINVPQQTLIINRVRPSLIRRGKAYDIDKIIDTVGIPLIGIIPEDEYFAENNSIRNNFNEKNSISKKAFLNIAGRLCGGNIPLYRFWTLKKYKKI